MRRRRPSSCSSRWPWRDARSKSPPCRRATPAQPGSPAPQAGAAAPAAALQGKVLERLDAPPYSYLKLQTAQGETWAAVPKTEVEKGKDVSVAGAMPMKDFESKTLNRKFDVVYFGTLAGEGGQAAPAGGAMARRDARRHGRDGPWPGPRVDGGDARGRGDRPEGRGRREGPEGERRGRADRLRGLVAARRAEGEERQRSAARS